MEYELGINVANVSERMMKNVRLLCAPPGSVMALETQSCVVDEEGS